MHHRINGLMTRRNFLRMAGVGTVGVAGGYGTARFKSKDLVTTFKSITGLGLASPIRVLHLSDFHASWCVPWKLIRESVELGMAEDPDLVVLTGDYVTSGRDNVSGYPTALAPLKGHPNCFASFGNHDGKYFPAGSRARQLEEVMGKAGVRFLVNRRVGTEIKGQLIEVAGLGDLWRKEARPGQCLHRKEDGGPFTLLLSHNPDTKSLVEHYHWDVMFSGHTHGGQFKVPFFGWTPVLPVDDRSMVDGIYPWDGRQIHITRGVGCLHGIRLFCPPEVSIVDLA